MSENTKYRLQVLSVMVLIVIVGIALTAISSPDETGAILKAAGKILGG